MSSLKEPTCALVVSTEVGGVFELVHKYSIYFICDSSSGVDVMILIRNGTARHNYYFRSKPLFSSCIYRQYKTCSLFGSVT